MRAGLISIVVGVFYASWPWMDSPATIFAISGYIGAALGPVAACPVAA